ncbi:MAG: hypothetical protein U0T82_15865 [Bacteroidales bacterium]
MKTNLTLTLALAALLTLSANVMATGNDSNTTLNTNKVISYVSQEAAPALEAWMTTPFTLASSADTEMVVKVEDWMKDSKVFMESLEPSSEETVVLENWMTDAPFTLDCEKDVLCETQVALEAWMLNF